MPVAFTTAAVGLTSIAVFAAALWALGILRAATAVLAVAQGAVVTMRDAALSEEAREKEVQRAALFLLGAFFSILGRSLLALLLSFLPIWLAEVTGLASGAAVVQYLSRWDIILVAAIVMLAGFRLRSLLSASA